MPSISTPKVRRWLARLARWTFHFTPTSASWLNALEGFFVKLAKRRLKRNVFRSLTDLRRDQPLRGNTNKNPKPFAWTPDPDKVLAAVKRGEQAFESIRFPTDLADLQRDETAE
jgi:hypothetical protein